MAELLAMREWKPHHIREHGDKKVTVRNERLKSPMLFLMEAGAKAMFRVEEEADHRKAYGVAAGVAEPPAFYLPVLRVKQLVKKEVVFDIEVEGTANFIANGICVHNCQIIAYV